MKFKRPFETKRIPLPANTAFHECGTGVVELDHKIKELIAAVERSALNQEQIRIYQSQISDAFQKSLISQDIIQPYKELNEENNLSREELLDGLEKLLVTNKIDSKVSRRYLRQHALQRFILCLIAVLLIGTGFAMIIMPAPPSFELFTVFYFNPNDGVTIMDLVSLLIILSGVFLFVLNFNKK